MKKEGIAMFQVIYHIDERVKWDLTLGNVKNMVNYYQEQNIDYEIEVLANSEAVCDYQKGSLIESQIIALSKYNVTFAACHNALNGQKIAEQDLIDPVIVVAAGVVELALRQSVGYSYIKP